MLPPSSASTTAPPACSRPCARRGGLGGIEDFLREYALSSKEGLALMVLAEALLRAPDPVTADRLIEDKLAAGDSSHHQVKSQALLVSASAWALGITARIIHPGETPDSILERLTRRVGRPAVGAATRQAMRLLGAHFVLGQTLEEALARAAGEPLFGYSFDMLGEGARNAAGAERYLAAYAHINRNMSGAVVGPQPFGGSGLSGTDPKAGGPNYLRRFAAEQVVSINVAAAGGNASLLATEE